jgi:hypothetical protein
MAEQEGGKMKIVYEERAYDPFSYAPIDPHEIAFLEDGGELIFQNRRRRQISWMMSTFGSNGTHISQRNTPKKIGSKGVPTAKREALNPAYAAAYAELHAFISEHSDWDDFKVHGTRLKALYDKVKANEPTETK